MKMTLHRNASNTPEIRQKMRESTKPERDYRLNRATVRTGFTPAILSPIQVQLVVALRQTLLLPPDDLLVVTLEYIHPEVSRSGLDRCLRPHGVSNLRALIPHPTARPNRSRPSRITPPASFTSMSNRCASPEPGGHSRR